VGGEILDFSEGGMRTRCVGRSGGAENVGEGEDSECECD